MQIVGRPFPFMPILFDVDLSEWRLQNRLVTVVFRSRESTGAKAFRDLVHVEQWTVADLTIGHMRNGNAETWEGAYCMRVPRMNMLAAFEASMGISPKSVAATMDLWESWRERYALFVVG